MRKSSDAFALRLRLCRRHRRQRRRRIRLQIVPELADQDIAGCGVSQLWEWLIRCQIEAYSGVDELRQLTSRPLRRDLFVAAVGREPCREQLVTP